MIDDPRHKKRQQYIHKHPSLQYNNSSLHHNKVAGSKTSAMFNCSLNGEEAGFTAWLWQPALRSQRRTGPANTNRWQERGCRAGFASISMHPCSTSTIQQKNARRPVWKESQPNIFVPPVATMKNPANVTKMMWLCGFLGVKCKFSGCMLVQSTEDK